MLLKVDNINVFYGSGQILDRVCLEIEDGEVAVLLGPNGAGKTTLLKAICGQVKLKVGAIYFDDDRISGLPTHSIARIGIAHCPEGRKLFPRMSVFKNLSLGAYPCKSKASLEKRREDAFDLFPILKERRNQLAGTLSGGEQQMLAIARALMLQPRLLLLDEPSLGLAPLVISKIYEVVELISRQRNTSLLLVEQNAAESLRIAHTGYVMEMGRIVLSGDAGSLVDDDSVKEIYLGIGV
jgi:branched-chain amino acid transport system ATP-binding protein